MAAVNYRGVEAVCSYIASTNMRFFSIYPAGIKAAKPVYAQKENVTNAKAADKFRDWAGIILQGDPGHSLTYELRMHEAKDDGDGSEGATYGKTGYTVSFTLSDQENPGRISGAAAAPAPAMQGGISMEMYLTILSQKNDAERRVDRLEYENADLRKQIIDLEDELAESDQGGEDMGSINGLIKMAIPMAMKHFTGGAAPAINGVPGEEPGGDCERCEHISPGLMDAIAVLKKHDADLDKHVSMLAHIAATNPGNFAFLLQMLDNQ